MFNLLINTLIRFRMIVTKYFYYQPFLEGAKTPESTQDLVLMKILKKQQDTKFGKEYAFDSIKNYAMFQQKVPVFSYEELRPYIDEQRYQNTSVLNAESIEFYASTSGTTGEPKNIPIVKSTIDNFKRCQSLLSFAVYSKDKRLFSGKILAIVSPSIEGHLDDGSPFGSMSGLVQQTMPRLVRTKYLLPYNVLEIKDAALKYRVIATYAASTSNVSLFATANPSTILKIHATVNHYAHEIFEVLRTGNWAYLPGMDDKLAKTLSRGFKKNPEQAHILQTKFDEKGELTYRDLWPQIPIVSCWTKGSCAVIIPKVKQLFPTETKFIEVGYIASEFRGSLGIDPTSNACLPNLQQNFFEFVEQMSWENDTQEFLRLHQLQMGKRYYVFATTPNGLYRYHINDILEVTGFYQKTPLLDFVQKGKGATNLTGEKLYECQIIEALKVCQNKLKFHTNFFLVLADQEQLQYRLYLEAKGVVDLSQLELDLDSQLRGINVEYASKRESERLAAMKVVLVQDGTYGAYKKFSVNQGQREGQFKVMTLQYAGDCVFPIDEWTQHEDQDS